MNTSTRNLPGTVQSSCMIDQRLRVLRDRRRARHASAPRPRRSATPPRPSPTSCAPWRATWGWQLLEPDGRRRTAHRGRAGAGRRAATSCSPRGRRSAARSSRASGQGLGHLRLAGFSTAASALLPAAWSPRRAPPSRYAEVRILEADPAVCFDLLQADKVDVAVVVVTDDADLPGPGRPALRAAPAARRRAGPAGAGGPPARRPRGRLAERSRRGGLDPGPSGAAVPPAGDQRLLPGGLHPAPGPRDRRVGHRRRSWSPPASASRWCRGWPGCPPTS